MYILVMRPVVYHTIIISMQQVTAWFQVQLFSLVGKHTVTFVVLVLGLLSVFLSLISVHYLCTSD